MIKIVSYLIVFLLGLGTSFYNPKHILVNNSILMKQIKLYNNYCIDSNYGLNQTDIIDFCTAYAALENFRRENQNAQNIIK